MALKAGDFVEVEYVGKIKESGEIFDLTDEKLAKEKKIFNPKVRYGPIVVVVGAGFVLKGLDAQLQAMKAGEKKTFAIAPADAFGERNPALIKLFSLADFKAQGATPVPGQWITLRDNVRGRVLSVAGGRVRVDFNHPLAGKALEYDLKINRKVEDKKEQAAAILEFFSGVKAQDVEVKIEKEKAVINLLTPQNVLAQIKKKVAEDITKYVAGVKEVQFTESFKAPAAAAEKKEEKKEEKGPKKNKKE